MADTAGVFEENVDYRNKYIQKYSRRTNIPSVVFLDVKFHPTMPDHVIVLSSMTLPNTEKINTLVPEDTLHDMEDEIQRTYYSKAEKKYTNEKKKPIVVATNQKIPDDDIPELHPNLNDDEYEGGNDSESAYEQEGEDSEQESDDYEQEDEEDDDEDDEQDDAQTSKQQDEEEDEGEDQEDPNNNLSQTSGVNVSENLDQDKTPTRKLSKKEEKKMKKEMKMQEKADARERKNEHERLEKKIQSMKFLRPKTAQKKQNKVDREDNEIWDRAIELYLKDNDKLFDYKSYDPIMLKYNETLETHMDSDEESQQNEENKIESDQRNQLLVNDFEEIESGGEVY